MDKKIELVLSKLKENMQLKELSIVSGDTFFLAVENAYNMVVITDLDGVIKYANPAAFRITGFTRKEAVGNTPQLWGGLMDAEFYRLMWDTISKGKPYIGEITNHRKNGDKYIAHITISPILLKGKVIGYVGTEEDITLQKQLQKQKDDFISMTSHQLRTPLGIGKWNLEVIMEEHKKLGKNLIDMSNANEHMITIVNNLLSVLRIGDNRLVLHLQKTRLLPIINETVGMFSNQLANLNVSITVDGPQNFEVITDPVLLREILSNLIDNAIKYSSDKKTIHVRISISKKTWCMSVQDQGIGIPKSEQQRVTEKFFRATNALSTAGTGLGLFIVNTYVQKMQGDIKIKSSVRTVTLVTCTFPLLIHENT